MKGKFCRTVVCVIAVIFYAHGVESAVGNDDFLHFHTCEYDVAHGNILNNADRTVFQFDTISDFKRLINADHHSAQYVFDNVLCSEGQHSTDDGGSSEERLPDRAETSKAGKRQYRAADKNQRFVDSLKEKQMQAFLFFSDFSENQPVCPHQHPHNRDNEGNYGNLQ